MDILVPVAGVAALFGVHYYFQSRRGKPPSKVERFFAAVWLLVRRVSCFGMAFCLWGGGGVLIYRIVVGAAPLLSLFWLGILVPIGYLFVHWGIYGRGYKKYDVLDDKPVHDERKKRYGWRW